MSQDNLVVNPTIDTGTDLSVKLNAWREAIHSCHMGNSRPAYAQAGITWIDEVSPSEWKWSVFDGANDLLIGTIDPTSHTLTLAIGSGSAGSFTDLAYTGTLTGGAGVIDIGNGQFFKDAAGKIGVGTKTPSTSFDLSAKTDAMTMPKGTTAQRPATSKSGDIRFNSETGKFEGFTTAWGDIGGSSLDPASITPAMVSDKANTSKGAFALPVGTSAERPTTPFNGMIRLNSDLGIEAYISDQWTTIKATKPAEYTVGYLLLGGGAGGSGAFPGGGGGGGEFTSSQTLLNVGVSLTINIGSGGGADADGSPTTFATIATAKGGSRSTSMGVGGTSGNGFGGGPMTTGGLAGAGGGGGASGGGGGGYNSEAAGSGGGGGPGSASSITGSSVLYGGGGGGGGQNQGSSGGSGGGGGGNGAAGNGGNGTPNTGGGGGGTGGNGNGGGGAGGSGVAILSIPTVSYSGKHTGSPQISTNGAFTVLKFNSSGTYTA